jgi:hypothetical protein
MAQAQAQVPHPPLEGAQLVIGTIAVSLAVFMNVLDTSIANVSIPSISGDLGVSSDQGTWVITSFAVANAISVPLTGWLTERIGQVRLFMASIILFVISSWMCGLAPTLPFLLASRVLQGAVAGPMIPLSQTLLLASYPRAKAPMALSMWAMTTLIAPVAGPILGGWISDNISWPWIFYVNIPVGAIAAVATWMIFRNRDSVIRKAPIDGVGLGLLIVWVGSLQVMLDKGKDLDWFSSTTDRRAGARRGDRARVLYRVGIDGRASGGRFVAVQQAQFHGRYGRAVDRLRTLLRQSGVAAAVAANRYRLHRDRSRPRDGAGRPVRRAAVADHGQGFAAHRSALYRDPCRFSCSRCASGCARVIRPASIPTRCWCPP